MKKLPDNFSLEKYGLKVRLVNESDAAFIISLRSNPSKTKYMVTLDDKIVSQKEWIRDYKEREKEGLDYYFIYSNGEDKPIGLNRISHVDYIEKTAKSASWIVVDGLMFEPFIMQLIQSEIAFNLLEIDTFKSELHKENSKVIKFYELLDAKFKDNGTDFYHTTTSKEEFLKVYDHRITKIVLKNL